MDPLNCYQCKHKHTDRPTDQTAEAKQDRGKERKKKVKHNRGSGERKTHMGKDMAEGKKGKGEKVLMCETEKLVNT